MAEIVMPWEVDLSDPKWAWGVGYLRHKAGYVLPNLPEMAAHVLRL